MWIVHDGWVPKGCRHIPPGSAGFDPMRFLMTITHGKQIPWQNGASGHVIYVLGLIENHWYAQHMVSPWARECSFVATSTFTKALCVSESRE